MSSHARDPIACPRCTQSLRRIKGLKVAAFECRHCHSFWLDRNQSDRPKKQDDIFGAEYRLAELTSKNNPDRNLRQIPLLLVIGFFLHFVLPILAIVLGLVFSLLSVTDGSSLFFKPFILVMAIPLLALGVHSFCAGRMLSQVKLTTVPRFNRFIVAASLYGLVFSIGFAFGYGAENEWATKLGMVLYVWTIFFNLPLLPIALYVQYSKRVKELYLTWDAAESSQSQDGG